MDAIEKLLAIEEIKKLKARYFRGIDLKDLDLLRNEVFAEDAVVDVVGGTSDPDTGINPSGSATEKILHGVEEIIANFGPSMAMMRSVHHGHMPEIEIVDDQNATGLWPMFDTLRFPEGPIREFTGYGHYHETYRLIDGKWKI